MHAGRKGEPGADGPLAALILDGARPGIVRATALSLLPQFAADTGPEQIKAYLGGVQDGDPLVRLAAVDAMEPFEAAERLAVVAPLLSDKVKAVRIAAARSLAGLPAASLSPERQQALDRASAELIESEQATSERPESQISIGAFQAQRGRYAEAESAYREALRLDPKSAPAMVNLADLYRQMNRDADAERVLQDAIAVAPDYAPAHHALGLRFARAHRLPQALKALRKAAILAPQDARYAYVYAIALNSAGRAQDALVILRQANGQHPADVDILTALITISRDAGDRAGAIAFAEQLIHVAPNDPSGKALLDSLRGP